MAVYFDSSATSIAGPGKAAEHAGLEISTQHHHLVQLREVFESRLLNTLRQRDVLINRLEKLIIKWPAVIRRAAV